MTLLDSMEMGLKLNLEKTLKTLKCIRNIEDTFRKNRKVKIVDIRVPSIEVKK